ncbi:MAG: electron transport complex subunit RsxC [Gammaproteobacteria bacterium]|nr:electron transport complex subunit RsxC [Gammaproteobacteria bacterium]
MKQSQPAYRKVQGGIVFTAKQQPQPIRKIHTPKQLIYPLTDQRGQQRSLIVEDGSHVAAGQPIAESTNRLSVPVHAACSGIISYAQPQNPDSVLITTDREQHVTTPIPLDTPLQHSPQDLIKRIEQAGVSGMGGAGYPAHLKLLAALELSPHTLILNAVECDPATTCDSTLLAEYSEDILTVAKLIMHICNCSHCMIAIEDQQTALLNHLNKVLSETATQHIRVVTVASRYPSGSEQQLVESLTDQTLRANQTALHAGAICFNIATALAIHRAIYLGLPLLQRLVTVSGPAIKQPVNIFAPIGTPLSELLSACGLLTEHVTVLQGGLMMGQAVPYETSVVLKETYSLWIAPEQHTSNEAQPCIRCGDCAVVCPVNLQPQSLYQLAQAHLWNRPELDIDLATCLECRACDLVCPSHIPLTDHFIHAKLKVQELKQSRAKALHARQRYEARQERLAKAAHKRQSKDRKRKQISDVNAMLERIKNKVDNNNPESS